MAYGMNPDALTDEDSQPPELYSDDSAEEQKVGDLLSLHLDTPEDHQKVAKKALKAWQAQDVFMSKRLAQWRANRLRRLGVPNVQVIKAQDENRWTVWTPPNASPDSVPAVNKAATLCRKMSSVLFADPPVADPIPASGEDQDVDAAEFTGRVLADLDSEAQMNEPGKLRKAFDRASSEGSGFLFYHVDPRAGGRQPVQIMAGDGATSLEDAEDRPVMQPVYDELGMQMGEEPMMGEDGEPIREPWENYVERFIMPDGMLSESDKGAAQQDVTGIKSELVRAPNVRFIPHTAEDLWDAHGCMVGTFVAWGKLRSQFPELNKLEPDKIKKILRFKPERAEDLLPAGERKNRDTDDQDEQLAFVLKTYYERCDDYPDGAYVVSVADCYVAHRQPWMEEIDGEKLHLPIPGTQVKQFDEGRDDPYGVGLMELIGPINEIRAAVFGAMLDHLEKFGQRKIFVPTSSIVNPKDLQQPAKTYIAVNPGGKPEYEDVPNFPTDGMKLWEVASEEADNTSNLQEVAQGVEDSDVNSGRHAYAIISQAHAQLSELKQNIERAYIRGCRVRLSLVRAYFDQPRRIKWTGEDGKYRERRWMSSDLGSTADVRIKSGSMSLLSPVAKMQLAGELLASRAIDLDQYKEMIGQNVAPIISLQDNPFLTRIRQQIAEHSEGPPEGWAPPPPVPQIVPGPLGPVTQMVPQPDPVLMQMWAPVPADMVPGIAQQRFSEICRYMSTNAYMKHPPEWRSVVDMEFQRMSMSAQPPMPPGAPDVEQQSPEQQARAAVQREQGVAA